MGMAEAKEIVNGSCREQGEERKAKFQHRPS